MLYIESSVVIWLCVISIMEREISFLDAVIGYVISGEMGQKQGGINKLQEML